MVYSVDGVCAVKDIGPIDIPSAGKDVEYYTLEPIYSSGSIYTPVNTKVKMRRVITKEEAQELIEEIPKIQSMESDADCNIEQMYRERLKSLDCKDLIEMIKTIYTKRKTAAGAGRKLGQIDGKYMRQAEDMLYGELAAALDMDKDQVKDYISETVESLKASAS